MAPNKPRRTNETSGAMDSRSLKGPFFEVPIKLDPFERTPEAPGHFAWMTEKTWIAPIVGKPLMQHIESLKEFPPRQKGTGIGAATLGAN